MKRITVFVMSAVIAVCVLSCGIFGSVSDGQKSPTTTVTPEPTPEGDYWEPIVY